VRYASDRTVDREERRRLLQRAEAILATPSRSFRCTTSRGSTLFPRCSGNFKGNPTNAGIFWNVHEWEIK